LKTAIAFRSRPWTLDGKNPARGGVFSFIG
jgi:hypothetical protein